MPIHNTTADMKTGIAQQGGTASIVDHLAECLGRQTDTYHTRVVDSQWGKCLVTDAWNFNELVQVK